MILVTGAAGFIGSHLCRRLQEEDIPVIGLDWKTSRRCEFIDDVPWWKADIAKLNELRGVFERYPLFTVVHLAAQTGVRHPVMQDYAHSNLTGFVNVLACCKKYGSRLIYASSSSVYGDTLPQVETARTDRPLSLYAATKKANELMAHASGIDAVGLRFFTVYGPWGRPDMIPLMFTGKILRGEPLELYNAGLYRRDFTYVDDVIDGLMQVIQQPLQGVYNIGRGQPVAVIDFVRELEAVLDTRAEIRLLPALQGEMQQTHADLTAFTAATGYAPKVSLPEGLYRMAEWYLDDPAAAAA